MSEFARLTFRPAGGARRKTVWARVVKRSSSRIVYREVTSDGEDTFDSGAKNGTTVEQIRLIVAMPSEVTEKPARMSLHYGELVVVGSAEDERSKKWER